jgi:hypothetical protein
MNKLLNAEEVAEVCKVTKSRAYAIMKLVNKEMKDKGYITIRGRVNSVYLFKRLGLDPKEVGQ